MQCRLNLMLVVAASILVIAAQRTTAFTPIAGAARSITALHAEETTVEVCSFKDCKRAGGGPRLLKLINEVIDEKDLAAQFKVTDCECQGECGYGPNAVINGKIVNRIKGREAVESALGIVDES